MANVSTMAPEDKAMWIAALRSGEFSQTRRQLFNRQGYCCLGVYLHLKGFKENPVAAIDAANVGCFSGLPTDREWHENIPVSDGVRADLINMNDSGSSFIEIADWIEKNLQVYPTSKP